ncbi:calmodulin-like 3 [Coemansia pectinata]|uniref:Calmodulin-like 3 n=1 Tax=Coemansia pectinata TaxID=1052879 RepID=A0A9W8L982_9FUNG|nr:calmodulin-like 3 [Coemansia pectinata]
MSRKQLTEEQRYHFKESFTIFDKDGDGSITITDLGVMLKTFGQNPSNAELQDMVKKVDTNGDGTVDFEGFLALMQNHFTESELRDALNVFDKDGNVVVNMNELRQAMANREEKLTDEEIDAMIRNADYGKYGPIDINEFVKLILGDTTTA